MSADPGGCGYAQPKRRIESKLGQFGGKAAILHNYVRKPVGASSARCGSLAQEKGPGDYPSPVGLVEPGGIEPPSESPPQAVLHV